MKDLVEREFFAFGKYVRLAGPSEDTYLNRIITNDYTDHVLLSIALKSVSDKSTIIDVGANIGYIVAMLKTVKPGLTIYAFEPNPPAFASLKRTVKLNKFNKVELFEYGLGDKTEKLTLSYFRSNLSGGFVDRGLEGVKNHKHTSISIKRLDQIYKKLNLTKDILLKVDIEGYEPNFLKGSRGFIKSHKPTMILEANHWCLNVFNRTSLPDFIDQVYSLFPHLFAFSDTGYLDLSDLNSLYKFFYENSVKNNYLNIYAGFDKSALLATLESCFEKASLEQTIIEKDKKIAELEKVIAATNNNQRIRSKVKRRLSKSN